MKAKLLFISVLFFLETVHAQNKTDIAHFSGHIKSVFDTLRLQTAYFPNFITGFGSEGTWSFIPVDKNGNFNFSIPTKAGTTRLLIYDYETGVKICNFNIVEPGDNIKIEASIFNDGWGRNIKFSGKGSAKYQCVFDAEQIDAQSILNKSLRKGSRKVVEVGDSLLQVKLSLIDKYKNIINKDIYQIIKADIIGEVKELVLKIAFWDIISTSNLSKANDKDLKTLFLTNFPVDKCQDNYSSSRGYTSYLYEKTKLDIFFQNGGELIELPSFYDFIKRNYSGQIREKLLTQTLINSGQWAVFFKSMEEGDLEYILKDALDIVKTAYLREPLIKVYNTSAKGALAYNFALPADSSDKIVRLSDFKGKVVFIDSWTYNCSGCEHFAKEFHEKIYPLFKDNPEFVVVSTMHGESSKDAYMRRLRQYGGVKLTYPDYVNLFGGKGIEDGRKFEKHYNITAAPLLLLIDKKGKIYSSTIPFATEENPANTEKLINLIRKALNES